ncbi:MAG: hypothetical protein ACQEUT_07045 [Bacillota bacterium]
MKQESIKPKVIMVCCAVIILCGVIALFFSEHLYGGYAFVIGFLTSVVFSIALMVEE